MCWEAVLIKRETGTVARVLMVLRALAESPGEPTMKELADRLNLPLSTMHRLLEMLCAEGMAERDESTRAFRSGAESFRIASLVVNRMPVRAVAKPFLGAAAAQTGESAYLCAFDARAGKLMFVANAESTHMLDYRVPMHTPFSITVGASGLAILAWLREQQRDDIIRNEALAGGPPAGHIAAAKLRKALEDVRAKGYAHTFGQRIKGAVGIFAPVFNASGDVVASFGVTVPEVRYRPADQTALASAVVRQAQALSRALGHTRALADEPVRGSARRTRPRVALAR
jgi:DNA-binding IclR family transcriptional regulator